MNARAVGRVVLLWIGLALLFAAIAAGRNFFSDRQLASRGVEVTGEVTRLEQSNHHLTYSYPAAGRILSGRGNAGFGNPEFESLHMGDPVVVTYLRNNISMSCLGHARERMRRREKYPGFRTLVRF